jgi:hypothetical protein
MSSHLSSLSLGEYIVMTIVPVILLAGWLAIIYDADRHPQWRHGPQRQQAPPGLGAADAGPGRVISGPPAYPVPPTSHEGDRPGGQGPG